MNLDLSALRHELQTQDNACTSDPLFVVYSKKRVYGMDPAYGDDTQMSWVNYMGDYEEAEGRRLAALNRLYEYCYEDEMCGWRRGFWTEHDEFVSAFLTRKAAREFVERHGSKFNGKVHIFVESMWRNEEMKTLRNALLHGSLQVVEAVDA